MAETTLNRVSLTSRVALDWAVAAQVSDARVSDRREYGENSSAEPPALALSLLSASSSVAIVFDRQVLDC